MSYLSEHDEHTAADPSFPSRLVMILGPVGALQLEECGICGYYFVYCEHSIQRIRIEDGVLTCKLCLGDMTET